MVNQTLDYSNSTTYDDSTSVTSSNVHMELLSSKHSPASVKSSDSEETHASSPVKKEKKKKDKDKSEKKGKQKKSKDKEKHSSKSERKSKRRSRDETSSRRDELEEFLNGSTSPPIDVAYEAI